MKNYSSNRAQKGKTAYRTPSRWIKNQPELFKKMQDNKLNDQNIKKILKKY
ncbi:MAG: hypothetical protein HZC26_03855 [Candidatus Magasanikbacteria bacterium]|nr:hypothetical protein [Candidatus Magasanikbacteria bacterium]